MPSPIDKQTVLQMLRERLAERLESLTSSQRSTQEGAVHPEGKQEHEKDTRAIEQQYLARGLAERVETLRVAVATLTALELRDFSRADVIRAGALVTLRDDDDRELAYFLAPAGGGEQVLVGGAAVFVVTPQSPLGRSLLGARVGDEIEIQLAAGKRSAVVESLS